MKAMNAFNAIHTLLGIDGTLASTPAEIRDMTLNHFRSILGPYVSPGPLNLRISISTSTTYSCSQEEVASVVRLPSADEIRKILFRINQHKTPGPDDLTSGL